MEGAGSVYTAYKEDGIGAVTWTFDKLREMDMLGLADDDTHGTPQSILVCHPQHRYTIVPPVGENIDPATKQYSLISQQYYAEMDAKIGSIIADPDHRIQENMREYGWHPIIKYGSVHSESAGEVNIEFKPAANQQECGSLAYRPIHIPVDITPSK
jgi:hypothetical protein